MSFNKYRLKGAYHYDWYETEPWYKACVDEIVDFCKGSTVDVGCGEGLLISKLLENGSQATGMDSDPYAAKLAQEMGINVRTQDIQDAFGGEWEYLSCLNVIEHLDRPEALIRIIKQNITKGAIIMTLEWQGGAFGEDHRTEYTYDGLLDFFKEFNPKGFRIKDHPEWIGVKIKC